MNYYEEVSNLRNICQLESPDHFFFLWIVLAQSSCSVTHIVHNAWPVDFNRSLSSLESQIKIVCNLVQLCLRSAVQGSDNNDNATELKGLLFASTITIVGRYPTVHLSGLVDVPEVAVEPHNTEEFGYPEAKWVCEQILLKANELFGVKTDNLKMPLLRTSLVRLGQLAGPEQSGTWNETEHFPIIVRTSQMSAARDRRSQCFQYIFYFAPSVFSNDDFC